MTRHIYLKSLVGEIFLISEGETIAGRSYENTIVINDPLVSSRHAVFKRHKDDISIMDLNSNQGTFVNNIRLRTNTAHPLNIGDQIGFGGWLTFMIYDDVLPDSETISVQTQQPQSQSCPNCKQPIINTNAVFCTGCGTKLSTAPRVCSECQTPMQASWKVCPRCGNRLTV